MKLDNIKTYLYKLFNVNEVTQDNNEQTTQDDNKQITQDDINKTIPDDIKFEIVNTWVNPEFPTKLHVLNMGTWKKVYSNQEVSLIEFNIFFAHGLWIFEYTFNKNDTDKKIISLNLLKFLGKDYFIKEIKDLLVQLCYPEDIEEAINKIWDIINETELGEYNTEWWNLERYYGTLIKELHLWGYDWSRPCFDNNEYVDQIDLGIQDYPDGVHYVYYIETSCYSAPQHGVTLESVKPIPDEIIIEKNYDKFLEWLKEQKSFEYYLDMKWIDEKALKEWYFNCKM